MFIQSFDLIDVPENCEFDYCPFYKKACFYLALYIFGTWVSDIYEPIKKKCDDYRKMKFQREFYERLAKIEEMEKKEDFDCWESHSLMFIT